MQRLVVLILLLCAGLVWLGFVLGNVPGPSRVLALPVLVVGGSGAAVAITLWMAHGFGLIRARRGDRADATRLERLSAELGKAAEGRADGLPAKPEFDRIPEDARKFQALWTVIDAAARSSPARLPVGELRTTLRAAAEPELERRAAHRQRWISVLGWAPVPAQGIALVMGCAMLWALSHANATPVWLPMALLLGLYGSFVCVVMLGGAAERLQKHISEGELGTEMIIETYLCVRDGHSGDMIGQILGRKTNPQVLAVSAVEHRAAA